MTFSCTIHNVRRVKTSSDHYALLADFHFHGYPGAGTPVVTVAIFNAGDKRLLTHRDLDVVRKAGAQIIFGCELRDRWKGTASIQSWCRAEKWRYYRGSRWGKNKVTSYESAILVNKKLGRIKGFTLKAVDGGDIGNGAGPRRDTARWALMVRVMLPKAPGAQRRRRARANFEVVHLRPSWTWSRVRRENTVPQIVASNKMTAGRKLPTVKGGDWNGESGRVKKLGLHADAYSKRVGTHAHGWAPDFFAIVQGK